MEKKIKLNIHFMSKLHQLIYDNSNSLVGLGIHSECKKFIKAIEKLDFRDNNR